ADEVGEDLPALVHVDDDRDVRHRERGDLRTPHRGPAVDLAGAHAPLPGEVLGRAVGAQVGGGVGGVATPAAPLEQQLVPRAAVPVGLGERTGVRDRDDAGLRFEDGHAPPLSALRAGPLRPRFAARRDTRLAIASLMAYRLPATSRR